MTPVCAISLFVRNTFFSVKATTKLYDLEKIQARIFCEYKYTKYPHTKKNLFLNTLIYRWRSERKQFLREKWPPAANSGNMCVCIFHIIILRSADLFNLNTIKEKGIVPFLFKCMGIGNKVTLNNELRITIYLMHENPNSM